MDIAQTIILSAVEGVTEFLPISSTGHLNIAREILSVPNNHFFTTFEIVIQFGAILAVVALYFKSMSRNVEAWKKVLAAFIPTAIIGFFLGKLIEHYLTSNLMVTLISLVIGGLVIIGAELSLKDKKGDIVKIEDIPYRKAVLIGLFQTIAVIPGVSRAASTILGSLFLGLERKTAVEFSFLLAAPTMLGASLFALKDAGLHFSQNQILSMIIGIFASFITAVIAIKFLLSFIKTHTFIPFGIYRIAIGILFYIILLRA